MPSGRMPEGSVALSNAERRLAATTSRHTMAPRAGAGIMAGRDEGTGALIEPRSNRQHPPWPCCHDDPSLTVVHPMVGETDPASHTEIRTLPVQVRIDTGKVLRIVTNDLSSPAEAIAELYKRRWAIELYFRWVKQTLRIRKFIGTSENAVRIQIAIALIAFLLLRLAQMAQHAVHSPLAFARLVRVNLMHRRSLAQLHRPAERPPPISGQGQLI